MILWLMEFFQALGWKVPHAFFYFSTRMLLAACSSLLFTLFLGPAFIRKLYELKIGQPIRGKEECPLLAELHQKKKDTPTMGGMLILASMVLSLVLWMDWKSPFTLLLLLTTVVLGCLGGIDDYLKLRYQSSKGIRARVKFLVQFGLSAFIALYFLVPGAASKLSQETFFRSPVAKQEVRMRQAPMQPSEYIQKLYIPFCKKPIEFSGWAWRAFLFFFFLLVITGTSNAVNLTDGLDGLAAGCLVMVFFVLGFVSFLSNHVDLARYLNILYIEGSGEIGVYLLSAAGGCLGFLWYNGHPAQVFMGDTGSLTLGGILGVSAVCLRREFLLAIAGALFVAEALSVILQVLSYRYRNQKRIFLCAPLHHHFEYRGWPETKVVMRFWILSLLFALIAIMSLKIQ